MTETISVRNTQTGDVGTYPARLFRNKVIFPRDVFVVDEPGAKPYVKELYKPRSVDEYTADHPVLVETDEDAVIEDDQEDEEK